MTVRVACELIEWCDCCVCVCVWERATALLKPTQRSLARSLAPGSLPSTAIDSNPCSMKTGGCNKPDRIPQSMPGNGFCITCTAAIRSVFIACE